MTTAELIARYEADCNILADETQEDHVRDAAAFRADKNISAITRLCYDHDDAEAEAYLEKLAEEVASMIDEAPGCPLA